MKDANVRAAERQRPHLELGSAAKPKIGVMQVVTAPTDLRHIKPQRCVYLTKTRLK